MSGTSKALMRRLHDSRFATRYFVGNGIDIGSGADGLGRYADFLPLMRSCRSWDVQDGDAQFLETIEDASLDFAHSSHCLEHLHNPSEAMHHWLRILKPGGHLVVLIPDEDLYEQGIFPSTFNYDHKWTFTIHKKASWSEKSINVMSLLAKFSPVAQPIKIDLLDSTFHYGVQRFDQTLTPTAECGIEFILRKHTEQELARGGRYP